MRSVICGLFVLVAVGRGDQAADRIDIDRAIDELNSARASRDKATIDALFLPDAEDELDRLPDTGANRPMSEITRARILIQSVRFITSDVALASATSNQYGSMILVRKAPLIIVFKKETNGWRIASLRILALALPSP